MAAPFYYGKGEMLPANFCIWNEIYLHGSHECECRMIESDLLCVVSTQQNKIVLNYMKIAIHSHKLF